MGVRLPTLPSGSSVATHRADNLARLGLEPGRWDYLVALAGNPNTGKSTVFNQLTGLRQHTGNWPGKTVVRAEGLYTHEDHQVKVVDLPGTYSLQAGSTDEEVARDFILFGRPDVTVVVVDATRLERNLNLVLQVLAISHRVVVCLNLMDEARRHGITIDVGRLEKELGVPVVPVVARAGEGMDALVAAIDAVASERTVPDPVRVEHFDGPVEAAVSDLVPVIEDAFPTLPNARWVALRLLNADSRVEEAIRTGEIGQLERNAAPPPVTGRRVVGVAEGAGDTRALAAVTPGGGAAGVALDDEPAGAEVLRAASRLRWRLPPDMHDTIVATHYRKAEAIAAAAGGTALARTKRTLDRTLDRLLTGPWTGFPVMLAILMAVFWITIAGANVPSGLLATLLVDTIHPRLLELGSAVGLPWWLNGFLFDGVYLDTAWVIAVMLPPMAIFFPLFTLLEDFGYLARIAFNLDNLFQRVGAHGKQALTMSMGYG
ncbi:MAG: 50S ribosome-binding GTPase, partial [Gemmatimonadetes bacterium]|nr:50S ribosome-binding GTPase [Gemmatimonadota bacterium]